MQHTTSKGKNVYSVDLMHAYINSTQEKLLLFNL